MFNLTVIEEIKRKFEIDLVSDVFPRDIQHLSFVLIGQKKEEAVIRIVSGDISVLKIFGKDNSVDFTVEDIINMIEVNNPISEVYGRDTYIDRVKQDLSTLNEVSEYYLPFKTKEEVYWFCFSCRALTKKNGENELIFGRVNFITNKTPKAIKYYENRFKDQSTNLLQKKL